MSYNQLFKSHRFDTMMYSDPEHLIFVYSPDVKHLRLLQLEKCTSLSKEFPENEYYAQNLHINSAFHGMEGESQWIFRPKQCILLDQQMATIQRQPEGKPISYHKRYSKMYEKQLQTKIFNWYSSRQSFFTHNSLTQPYYYYSQINNFCFGRKHFVRTLNSIELASDHVSRNHCEIAVAKGRGTKEIRRYFELLFGVFPQETKSKVYRKSKVSKGNKLMLIPTQLWQKIYEYIFLTRDKYYMLDNGSRNGSFFIQCPITKDMPQHNILQEYSMYGNRIEINHKLLIREGFSYEYEGEQYLMKVWRLTHGRKKINEQDHCQFNLSHQEMAQKYSLFIQNTKTIKSVQEFQEKINWFNNFQKVSKDYIIDDLLLKRKLWKGKKVYEDMIKENLLKNQKKKVLRRQDMMRHQFQGGYNDLEQEEDEGYENRPNQSYQPFSLLPSNQTSPQTEFITKAEFVRLIYQEYVLLHKILKRNAPKEGQYKSEVKGQETKTTKESSTPKTEQTFSPSQESFSQFFINQHKLNTMVISLDFSNDFKKLYCIITESERKKKFHIGSQMIINTARFQFEDHNKCNGYIEFDGKNWYIIALKQKSQTVGSGKSGKNGGKARNLSDSEDSENEQNRIQQEIQIEKQKKQARNIQNDQMSFFNTRGRNKNTQKNDVKNQKTQKKQGQRVDLSKQLSNKIWTKIPSMSHYQLNPQKCSRYILRLAHAFYFELKFINFTKDSQKEE